MTATRYGLGTITAIAPVRVRLDGHGSDVPAGLVDGVSINISDRVNVLFRTPLKPLILGKELDALDASLVYVTQAELTAQLAGVASYHEYTFTTPAATWTVTHSLGLHPVVQLLDAAGNQFEADVAYPDLNTVVITHAAPLTGSVLIV